MPFGKRDEKRRKNFSVAKRKMSEFASKVLEYASLNKH